MWSTNQTTCLRSLIPDKQEVKKKTSSCFCSDNQQNRNTNTNFSFSDSRSYCSIIFSTVTRVLFNSMLIPSAKSINFLDILLFRGFPGVDDMLKRVIEQKYIAPSLSSLGLSLCVHVYNNFHFKFFFFLWGRYQWMPNLKSMQKWRTMWEHTWKL